MLISLQHRFAFLCNRKCASISIETMLRRYSDVSIAGPPDLRHCNYRTYETHVAPFLEAIVGPRRIETVCLVREPVSWLYSWYRFRSRLALRDPENKDHHKSTAGITFTEFVAAYMQPTPPPFANVGCQFDFVRAEEGEIGVDRIFRYELIDDFVRFMSERIGKSLRLAHKNVSPKSNRRWHVAALVDRAIKTATSQLNLKALAEAPARPPGLPRELLAGLNAFLRADFALYERAGGSPERRPLARRHKRHPPDRVVGTRPRTDT